VFESVAFQGPLHLEALAALSALEGLDVEVHQVVSPEGIRPLEPLVAHCTRERPLACVCELVLIQVRLLSEAPAANSTRERKLACVCELMLFQDRLAPEALATHCALEGLDVEVHQVVSLEGIRPLVLLVTHCARERPLICVCDSVVSQGGLLTEAPAANGTRERQLARVCELMLFQVRLPLEAPAALRALKGLDVKVHQVVNAEGIRTLELLVTYSARERPLVSVCESVLFQGRQL